MESTLAFPNLGGEHSSSGGNGPESMDEKCVADQGVCLWYWRRSSQSGVGEYGMYCMITSRGFFA